MRYHGPLIASVALASIGLLVGCGSGGRAATGPVVRPAHIFAVTHFKPTGPVLPARPTLVSFTIRTPSGKPLTQYKECCAAHEGVDFIVVRSDDSHIQYLEAEADSDGR